MSNIVPGWGKEWETLAEAITSYFGGGIGSQQYQQVVSMLNSGNYTMEEMEAILSQIPEFERTYNANGELIKVAYNAKTTTTTAAGSAAQQINSNVANATESQFSTTQTIAKDAQTGKVTISDSVKKYNNGTATTVKSVTASAVTALAATATGISVGKTIDAAAYNAGFNWLSWAGVDMWALNPSTWGSITAGNDSPGSAVFNFIFHLDPTTGDPQPYIDETTFSYMVAYMGATGAFNSHGGYVWDGQEPGSFHLVEPVKEMTTTFIGTVNGDPVECYYVGLEYSGVNPLTVGIKTIPNDDVKITSAINSDGHVVGLISSKNTFPGCYHYEFRADGEFSGSGYSGHQTYTHNDQIVYYSLIILSNQGAGSIGTASANFDYPGELAWVLQYGDFEAEGIPGIYDQVGAKQFDTTGISDYSDIDAIKTALMLQYPELWNNRIEVSPDGDNTIIYLPVGFPTGGTGVQATTEGATQAQPAPQISQDGANATDELIKTLIEMIQYPQSNTGMDSNTTTPATPADPNDIPTGTGNTPTFVIPTGSASALYSVYNPTQAQLNSFGSWLWSNNFVDQLLKIFNDPMQSIIGLHKVFATPPTSGTGTIKVGYLDSGVGSDLVSNQYTEVDCGNVTLQESFKNVLDYTATDVYLYLPFIGIVPLNVFDVMRGKINVKYKVDVITGACLATVNVTRDANAGGQLYTYAGNCAVQYPLSSGSYMGIVAGALSVAGSVVGTIASGGALLPMALGVSAGALTGSKTKVEHSGSISGNAGAMGIKKPYLIIRRPQTCIADLYETFNGNSNNKTVILGTCTGFTKVKHLHLENIPATGVELIEIEDLLRSGILI